MEVQPRTIRVTVNGQITELAAGQSVASVLSCLKVVSERVAVELNRSIVRKRDWERTIVPGDSQIEIVEFVGGG